MRKFRYLALLSLAAVLTACDDSEVFYSVAYPVVKVEAVTMVSGGETEPTDPPTEPTEPPTEPTDPTGPTQPAEEPQEPEEPTVAEQINADVLANAPVLAGGCYNLDFTRHNGGPLLVECATEAGNMPGTFVKTPGLTDLQFIFGESDYTCKVSAYTDEAGQRMVLLSVDLTKQYQALHPDWKITSVIRKEFTSTPYK